MVHIECLCARLPSENEYTLDEQEKDCRLTAAAHGWAIYSVIKETAKPSMLMADRPAIQDLLNDLRADSFDILMITDMRRIIGSSKDITSLLALLKLHRKSLYITSMSLIFPADALDNEELLDALQGGTL